MQNEKQNQAPANISSQAIFLQKVLSSLPHACEDNNHARQYPRRETTTKKVQSLDPLGCVFCDERYQKSYNRHSKQYLSYRLYKRVLQETMHQLEFIRQQYIVQYSITVSQLLIYPSKITPISLLI